MIKLAHLDELVATERQANLRASPPSFEMNEHTFAKFLAAVQETATNAHLAEDGRAAYRGYPITINSELPDDVIRLGSTRFIRGNLKTGEVVVE